MANKDYRSEDYAIALQKAIEDFNSQLLNSQEDLGVDFKKVLNENFWELLA